MKIKQLENALSELLTEQQTDDAIEFVSNCVKDAVKKNIVPADLISLIRDNMSYNQLVFLSTMLIGNRVVETVEEMENQLNEKLKEL